MRKIIKEGLTILISVLVIFAFVKAGSLTPSATPADTMYTLDDIYHRLTYGGGAPASYNLDSPASPAATMHSIEDIYSITPNFRTNGGTAVAGDVCNSATFYSTSSTKITGTRTDCGAGGYTYGSEDDAYVLGTATGPGTALTSTFNGTGQGYTGGHQADGGVDDYNNAGSAPTDTYGQTATSSGWTACNSGNTYCGTSLSSADAKDNSTGLVWSLPCNGVGCTSFSDTTPLTYTWDSSGGNNNSQTASQLCSSGSHGESGWSLPHQKQLMQAYINGSYGNLEAVGVNRYYWSATTKSNNTTNAWSTNLSNGYTINYPKTFTTYVRCVRLP